MKIFKRAKMNRGMTYVELIVVLSIFAIMSAVSVFSYRNFQANIDIKNLATDIALKIIEAQKSALNGLLPADIASPPEWKPTWGVYFDLNTSQQFIYFKDLSIPGNGYDSELEKEGSEILITKGNHISSIDECSSANSCTLINPNYLSITFTRPDSSAVFSPPLRTGSDYVQITVSPPSSNVSAKINVYPSGRVEIK